VDAEDHRQRVRTALAEVPRARFLPRASTGRASYDGPLQIGRGQTCSQPRTVAAMLELLAVEHGHRVLDVGAGSGWTTALLAHLTGPEGAVLGIELEPDLVAFGSANLGRTAYGWASVRQAAPGVLGLPELAPYDRVLVSARARELPTALVEQLDEGGRIVVPVNGTMLLGLRRDGDLEVTEHGSYRFVPLRQAPDER
jgi:protein-L-isoaspartate(D-aspartate) O-methyltransferase